jgi:hypothetical protein
MKGWAHFLLVALLTVSQGMDVDPSEFSFGPYEAVRQQVWNYCRSYAAEGLDAYMNCAAQVNQFLCSPLAPDSLLCTTAAMTPYPFPGRDVLTAREYRVEVAGGIERERDIQTGQVRRQQSIPSGLFYTLTRHSSGLYRGTTYNRDGQPTSQYWVNARCELTDAQGTPLMDGQLCPLFTEDKPYLVILTPRSQSLFGLPGALTFKRGRLADDFDQDGVIEVGYLRIGGTSGREFASGTVTVFAYDPQTKVLKFFYYREERESQDNPYLSYIYEQWLFFRVQARSF